MANFSGALKKDLERIEQNKAAQSEAAAWKAIAGKLAGAWEDMRINMAVDADQPYTITAIKADELSRALAAYKDMDITAPAGREG